eukprot:TRINITY_DN6848_c0_g1_i3.p1 TRINITY_DN6848_c0_g1~~TRINITY_DN6848_c0_g1_i3.p1  ORF type:complete len:145 (-),score=38.55 TRINITY_DN6848_c0_g1_i3:149-583(-)
MCIRDRLQIQNSYTKQAKYKQEKIKEVQDNIAKQNEQHLLQIQQQSHQVKQLEQIEQKLIEKLKYTKNREKNASQQLQLSKIKKPEEFEAIYNLQVVEPEVPQQQNIKNLKSTSAVPSQKVPTLYINKTKVEENIIQIKQEPQI